MKNIWFIPQYEYLNAPIMSPLIERLGSKYHIFLVQLPNYNLTPGLYPPSAEVITLNTYSFPQIPEFSHHKGKISKGISFFSYYFRTSRAQFSEIKKIFETYKPSAIVLPSDAGGNWGVHDILSIAAYYQIPAIILFPTDISGFSISKSHRSSIPINRYFGKAGRFSLYLCNIASLVHKIVIRLNYLFPKYQFWRYLIADIPGCYATDAKIFVISPEARQKLIDFGIDESRVEVFNCFPFGNDADTAQKKEAFLKKYQTGSAKKIVVYYTETLQDIPEYGNRYVKTLNEQIIALFQQMKTRYDIDFFVKLHPNEPRPGTPGYDELTEVFNTAGIPIIDSIPLRDLLQISDLSIAHFSRVLIESVMAETPILSINLRNDGKCTFLDGEERTIVEIASMQEFEQKILDVLFDGKTMTANRLMLEKIRHRFSGNKKDLMEIADYIDRVAKNV